MASDVVREIDQNFAIPDGLKDTFESNPVVDEYATDSDIDIQFETLQDESSELDSEQISGDVEPPETIEIITQEVRTAPDGRQVIDIIIEVEDVPGAVKYDVRITKLEEV